MSADNGISVRETPEGFEVRHWMGEGEGRLLGTFPSIDAAIKRGQEEGMTEYGFSFKFLQDVTEFDSGQVEISLGNGQTFKCYPTVFSNERIAAGDDRIDWSYVIPSGVVLKRYVVILAEVK